MSNPQEQERAPWYDAKHSDGCAYFKHEYGVNPCGEDSCPEERRVLGLSDVTKSQKNHPELTAREATIKAWREAERRDDINHWGVEPVVKGVADIVV